MRRASPSSRWRPWGDEGHTRAFLKIQDGCTQFCAYCIIPYARGPLRSKELSALREEVAGLAAAGYREVVLTGINLSLYGRELGLRPPDAVEAAASVPGIDRVRIGSLEPELLTDADIAPAGGSAAALRTVPSLAPERL